MRILVNEYEAKEALEALRGGGRGSAKGVSGSVRRGRALRAEVGEPVRSDWRKVRRTMQFL